jgi:hypothetical protein
MNKVTQIEYQKIHKWLRNTFGYANKCESLQCNHKSRVFEWALIKGAEYEYKRSNFFMLCRSCHIKYDRTQESIMRGASKLIGRKHREETIKLMREIARANNRKPPPLTTEQLLMLKNRMIGNQYGFKKGFIPWNKGKIHLRGKNHPMFGKHHTEQTKLKLKEKLKGRTVWNKGIPCPEEVKRKISITKRGVNE